MKLEIPEAVASRVSRQLFKLKSNSPRILFVAGVVGVVGGAVLACRATLKLPKTLDTFKDEIDQQKSYNPEGQLTHYAGAVTKTEYNRGMAVVYAKGTFEVVKLYAPAIFVGGLSIIALTASHRELGKRNAALASAYTALQASYEAYRARIREELGEDKERDIYQNARYEKKMIDGKSKNVKIVDDPSAHSPYARFFDETSSEWTKSAEQNKTFLLAQQNYFNHRLHAYGHVFLNEVYDNLGLPRSQAGQVVGWLIGPTGGDGYIDFGIHDINNSSFVNGVERSILLDFNVDGVIYNKIEK